MELGPDGLVILPFPTQVAARSWLATHHETDTGVWVKIAKKASGHPTVTYAEFLDEALCVGWIDGQKRSYDSDWFLQRFTPRTRRSQWSRTNQEHVARLEAAGLMLPAGQAQVTAAKADGRWEAAYAGQRTIEVPPDLQAALDADPAAKAFFAEISSQNRFAVLYRIGAVKRADTRARKIEQYVAMLARRETLH
ncbi:MAG TPA: YdeI/OmpD-associated family protein [Candidatus Nanopelagicales bacterium]